MLARERLERFRLSRKLSRSALARLLGCHPSYVGMVERGFGRVVNVSSDYGSYGLGLGGPAPYAVSKVRVDGTHV